MRKYMMVYVLLKNPWVSRFWRGTLTKDDPFWPLLNPTDQRGEVYAWGPIENQHISLTDAEEYGDLTDLIAKVTSVGKKQSPIIMELRKLAIHRGTQLVLVFDCPTLERIKKELQDITGPLICKTEISDEEFQRSRWWVEHMSNEKDLKINLSILEEAHSIYRAAGEPKLATSRHFRLNMLVSLVRQLKDKTSDETRSRQMLTKFLEKGIPPWYGESGTLHLTLASGLIPGSSISNYRKTIWPKFKDIYSDGILVNDLAIMIEDKEKKVTVNFFDSLCQRYVTETRSGFKLYQRVLFKQQ